MSGENGAWTRPPPGSRIATLTFGLDEVENRRHEEHKGEG